MSVSGCSCVFGSLFQNDTPFEEKLQDLFSELKTE